MDTKDLMSNAKNLKDYEFKRKLNDLVRNNYRYRNLNSANKKIVLDLVKKYKSYLRKGIGISTTNLRNESYRLYQNRLKLGLTQEDLKDIKEILGELRS